MFAYCINNPVNSMDPSGEDAIWLQYPDGASGAGHSGLLIEDENEIWYLFYLGTNTPTRAILGIDTSVIKNYIQAVGHSSIDASDPLNDVISLLSSVNPKLSEGITSALYFEGDFTASLDYINHINPKKTRYNLYKRNCLQMSINALSKGAFANNDTGYKDFLRRMKGTLIPNMAFTNLYLYYNYNINLYKLIRKRFYLVPPNIGVGIRLI